MSTTLTVTDEEIGGNEPSVVTEPSKPFGFIQPIITQVYKLDPSTSHWYSGQVIPVNDPLIVKFGEYNNTIELLNYSMYDLVDVTEGRVPYKKALVRHKKYETLFLLPTSQIKDKSAVNPAQLMVLCDELRKQYDYVIIDCPAGIEQGFKTAIAAADRAIVVTMPEVSAVRDADKIIGELGRAEKDNISLIVNRIRPQMVESGDMMDMSDIDDILSIKCIGQIPDDEMVVTSANRGEPLVGNPKSQAGRAYDNIVRRILGEEVPFMTFEKDGLFTRLKKALGM